MFEFIFSTVPKWIMLFIILIIPFATYALGVHTTTIIDNYNYIIILQDSGYVVNDTYTYNVDNLFLPGFFNMPRDYIICKSNNLYNYSNTIINNKSRPDNIILPYRKI